MNETPDAPRAALAAKHQGTKRVLVIDDEPTVLQLIVATLHQCSLPLEIHTTTRGYEGCIQYGRLRPDLVILDVHMPDIDGAEVLRSMKQAGAGASHTAKVLVISGSMESIERMRRLGSDGDLCKPFQPDELVAKAAALLESCAETGAGAGMNVLLVEDNPADARLVRELLDESPRRPFAITHAGRLQEALELLELRAFDLILLDLSLPDAQGLETILKMRPMCGDAPIVVMTGLDDEELAMRAVKVGAQDYLVKGQVDPRTLTRTMHYAVERNRTLIELERAREREHFLATHDSLTGLANRTLFYDHLRQALTYAERYNQCVAVLFLDLDDFKEINDHLGHSAGDRLLRGVSHRLVGCIRRSDTAARLGGDEFTLLLQNLTHHTDAAHVAENVLRELAEPFQIDGRDLAVSASLGVALYPEDGTDAESLIRNADMALYSAKQEGSGTYRFYTSELNHRARERHVLERALRAGLELEQFIVHYQPQVDVATAELFGAEALVRWNHPELGLVSPDQFIPQAEEAGVIAPLCEWVMNTACAQHKAWRDAGLPAIRMAVNLSVHQLRDRQLPDKVHATLRDHDMEPAHLELEITEGGILKDSQQSLRTLRALKRLGVRISLDDFGTGQASLSYLRQFPADTVKLDRSFVRHLLTDRHDTAIAAAILAMAHGMRLEAIAEGVETRKQLEFLLDCRCHRVQGFLFCRALPAVEFERYWTSDSLRRMAPVVRARHPHADRPAVVPSEHS